MLSEKSSIDLPESNQALCRAFSLIELLVSIGVIALLLSLLLPSLAGVRNSAMMTKSASNARQVGMLFDQYTTRYDENYPVVTPGMLYPTDCGNGRMSFGYWPIQWHWAAVVLQDSLPQSFESYLLSPGTDRWLDADAPCSALSSYSYSTSFVADPKSWVDNTSPDEMLFRSARQSEVLYPSSKSLAWDWELAFIRRDLEYLGNDLNEKTPVLFVDGHVAQKVPAEAREPHANVLRPDWEPKRLGDTAGGVRGLDY